MSLCAVASGCRPSLPIPIGRTSFPPVIVHEYIGEKLDAIGMT